MSYISTGVGEEEVMGADRLGEPSPRSSCTGRNVEINAFRHLNQSEFVIFLRILCFGDR